MNNLNIARDVRKVIGTGLKYRITASGGRYRDRVLVYSTTGNPGSLSSLACKWVEAGSGFGGVDPDAVLSIIGDQEKAWTIDKISEYIKRDWMRFISADNIAA